MHVHRIFPAVAVILGLLAGCGNMGQLRTEHPPIRVSERPLSALAPSTKTVLRIDVKKLRDSSLTGPLLEQLLADSAASTLSKELRAELQSADEVVVGIGHSQGQNDSDVLMLLRGAFGDGETFKLHGDDATVRAARARIDGHAPASGLDDGDQRWRAELGFDRSAVAYMAYPGAYRAQGQTWNVPDEWKRVALALDVDAGVSARLTVDAASPELARRTLQRFESMRHKALGSIAVRILGFADVLAALEFRNVRETVTARIHLTEQEAQRIVQRLQLIGGLKDLLGASPATRPRK